MRSNNDDGNQISFDLTQSIIPFAKTTKPSPGGGGSASAVIG